MNSADYAVVSEQIYDYQGRAAISILPAPVSPPAGCVVDNAASALKFYRNFNTNEDGDQYSAKDFDTDTDPCVSPASPMSTTSGASNYYSPENPDKEGFQAFVPDGKKYPFAQVEYLSLIHI